MSFLLMGLLYFVVDLAAILLLVATWQRTRILGFAIVAASFAAGILARWTVPWLYRMAGDGEGDMIPMASLLSQAIYLAVAVVAVAGFWDIYRALKSRPAA